MTEHKQPKVIIGSPRCECRDCGLFFTGPTAFDKHQLGQGTAQPYCRTPVEMLEAGMILGDNDVWQIGTSKKKLEAQT